MSLLKGVKDTSSRIEGTINAYDVSLNLAMLLNKGKIATAGLVLLGGVIALLALNWNASEQTRSEQQSVLNVASGRVVSETDAFHGGSSQHLGRRGHLSDQMF